MRACEVVGALPLDTAHLWNQGTLGYQWQSMAIKWQSMEIQGDLTCGTEAHGTCPQAAIGLLREAHLWNRGALGNQWQSSGNQVAINGNQVAIKGDQGRS